jgi:PEP-CTERM motif
VRSLHGFGLVATVAVALVSSVWSAQADTVYDWTLTGTAFGSGTITLGAAAAGQAGANGGFVADAMTGEISASGYFSASDISGLTTYYGDDNIVYPNNTTVVDDFGLSVLLDNGISVSIDPGGPYNVQISSPNQTLQGETFDLTLVSNTPLPATWIMMLAGLALLGFVSFRRRTKAPGAFTAA